MKRAAVNSSVRPRRKEERKKDKKKSVCEPRFLLHSFQLCLFVLFCCLGMPALSLPPLCTVNIPRSLCVCVCMCELSPCQSAWVNPSGGWTGSNVSTPGADRHRQQGPDQATAHLAHTCAHTHTHTHVMYGHTHTHTHVMYGHTHAHTRTRDVWPHTCARAHTHFPTQSPMHTV